MRPVPVAVVIGCLLAAAPAAGQAPPPEPGPAPLTLEEAVAIALRDNPGIDAAAGRAAAAAAAAGRASADRWPQVRVEGRYARLGEAPSVALPTGAAMTLGEEGAWTATAALSQAVWTGGRLAALVRQAEGTAAAVGASRERARQLVAAGAARAFWALFAAQEEVRAAGWNLNTAQNNLDVARRRFEARAVPRFDVLRAEVSLEEARQDQERAGGGQLAAAAGLLQALGLADGAFEAHAPAEGPRERAREEELLRDAVRNRPELAALGRLVDAAAAGLDAARAERMPVVGLAADWQYATPESAALYTRWSAGVSVSLPVLDGGRAAARRREAAAGLLQARAALEAQRRQVEAEVRQGLARLRTADAQVDAAGKRLELAGELLRLASVRYEEGVGTATEVADAQASLARARSGRARARAEQGVAEAELALAVGAAAGAAAAGAPGGGGR